MKYYYLLFFSTVALLNNVIISQGSYHIIGNGNIQNFNNTYPSVYGNDFRGVKNQFLIRASEMQAAGMTAGNITGLGFDVITPSGATLNNFEIEIKSTTQNSISSWDNNNLSTHFGPIDYTDQVGWNQHDFSNTPFYWNGSSNLIIKTCFYNNSGLNNAVMKMSNYSYNTLIYRRSNGDPCPATWINGVENKRPNIRFQWLDPNSPPISDFSVSSNSTCSGAVSFTDLSTSNTTSWLWDFGDGNTSNLQNPNHNYTSSGNFDVELISSNSFGSDTSFFQDLIEVNLAGAGPLPANCIPETQYPGSLNCGITEFNFGDFSKNSSNSIDGYSDFTCGTINLYAGQFYEISATHQGNAQQNFSMWVDWNNNGDFDLPNEEVYSIIGANSSQATIQIPASATLNSPLRLRIMADNTFQGGLLPCSNPVNGQAEDYTVLITTNTNPPESDFSADRNYTCNGNVEFTDLSTNLPFSWYWQFGDGSTSLMQNPVHNYIGNGSYDITLVTVNDYGTDTITKQQYIVVDNTYNVTQANCSPTTLNHFADYGIEKVEFANINNLSLDGEEGYMDFTCDYQAYVNTGESYLLKVVTGSQNPHDTKVWIDYDNNGFFDSNDSLMEQLNTYNPQFIIQIPNNAIYDTSFRLRISSDLVGSNNGPCDDPTSGQVEDYGIFISLCANPENITLGQVSNNAVELIWIDGGGETSWNVQYGEQGFNPLTETGTIINNIFVNNYYVTGLDQSENYDFYIQSNCSNNSSSWIGPLNATTTGIYEHRRDENFNVFPNPNNGIFSINTTSNFDKIEIFNLVGQKIFTFNNEDLNYINLSKEPTGIYFVKVSFENSIITKRIIYN